MATGVKLRNSQIIDGVSFMDAFNIALADANNLQNAIRISGNADKKNDIVFAVYTGSGAINLANYNGLPVGSVIFDMQAFKIHLKTGATAWKSSAAFT